MYLTATAQVGPHSAHSTATNQNQDSHSLPWPALPVLDASVWMCVCVSVLCVCARRACGSRTKSVPASSGSRTCSSASSSVSTPLAVRRGKDAGGPSTVQDSRQHGAPLCVLCVCAFVCSRSGPSSCRAGAWAGGDQDAAQQSGPHRRGLRGTGRGLRLSWQRAVRRYGIHGTTPPHENSRRKERPAPSPRPVLCACACQPEGRRALLAGLENVKQAWLRLIADDTEKFDEFNFDPFTGTHDVHANALVPRGAQVGHPLTDSKKRVKHDA